jgi:3-oxoacyl-[acyl-carrier-protein] synthase-3
MAATDAGALVASASREHTPAPQLRGAAVGAPAMAVPDTVVGNEELAARLDVDAAWIERRTGVRERRIAADGERVVDYAAAAAERSLAAAGLQPRDLDLLLVATMTPDDITPNAAPLVAAEIGASGCAALDLGAACTGWLDGIALAAAQIETGRATHALVVGADLLSRITNEDDVATAPLFADGAAAVVLGPCAGDTRVGPAVLGTDAEGAGWVYARHDEGFIRMQGYSTFKAAVEHLADASTRAATAAGTTLAEIDRFAFHQGNGRIITSAVRRLGLPEERVLVSVDRFGNTSAASIPMTLADAAERGALEPGMRVLLAAFGAGFTYGAAVVEWGLDA